MAATVAPSPPFLSPQSQKELLLATRIHGQAGWGWGPDVPLNEFEGVAVDGEGFIVGLDFSEQKELEFDLAVFAPLTSLQVVNFRLCENATGECSWVDLREGKEQVVGVYIRNTVGPDFNFVYESWHQYYTYQNPL